MADDGFSLPTDVLVDILLRHPPSSRRRFRLVCKRWRAVIDERMAERQVGTQILAFFSKRGGSRAYVLHDKDGSRRHAWTFPCSHHCGLVKLVGTCNGLLCLHETLYSGDIMVTNPITDEKLTVPPMPTSPEAELDQLEAHGMYSFGYHPTTGQYKIVHVPCRDDGMVHTVLVFTLDRPSWREVPLLNPGATCNGLDNIASVDGSTYWLTARCDRVMALDLDDERVTSFGAPPMAAALAKAEWHLTNVHARLGVVVTRCTAMVTRVDVWVMEGKGEWPRWSRRYSVVEPSDAGQGLWITAPCFTYGQYVLSGSWDLRLLYRRKVSDLTTDGGCKNRKLLQPMEGAELIMHEKDGCCGPIKTFAYVEALEPLPTILGCDGNGGSNPS